MAVVRVPEDCSTLREAIINAKADPNIRKISVGKGEHQVGGYLEIDFPITIVGIGDRNEVLVVGGFFIKIGVQGNVHVQNMTIQHLEEDGVHGKSPFTLEDVIVDQCRYGVVASGTAGDATNVIIRNCTKGGVTALNSGSFTLKDVIVNKCEVGVRALSGGSVALKDVIVDECELGVNASDNGSAVRCIDVQVNNSDRGVIAMMGGLITLKGKTNIESRGFELLLIHGKSLIQFVHPLHIVITEFMGEFWYQASVGGQEYLIFVNGASVEQIQNIQENVENVRNVDMNTMWKLRF